RDALLTVASLLRTRGVNPWLDAEQIRPGLWWQKVIQETIPRVKSGDRRDVCARRGMRSAQTAGDPRSATSRRRTAARLSIPEAAPVRDAAVLRGHRRLGPADLGHYRQTPVDGNLRPSATYFFSGRANATMLLPEGASFLPPPHTITTYSRPSISYTEG